MVVKRNNEFASRAVWLLAAALLFFTTFVPAVERPPAAAIASAHPLATAAGIEILQAGGNAFDAAIAVSAALAVVEPYSSGLGGGGFYLLHRARDGRDVMLDARERAPQAARADMYLDPAGAVIPNRSLNGPLAAAIPGEPAALAYLAARFGRLPLANSLAPALRYARDGFAVDEHYARMSQMRLEALRAAPEAARIFLSDGAALAPGTLLSQPDLARTLEALVARGAAGFYSGELADRLIDGVKAAGGNWTREDLADYRVIERKPLQGEYRGLRITTAAPPSSGGVVLLEMLNILSGYDLDKLDAVTRDHLLIEAMRRAYRDRAEYLGDPDVVAMPLDTLLAPAYAAGLRAAIRLDRATPSATLPDASPVPQGNDTTHFSIIDREGNQVAATLSVNMPFGSGFVVPGTGVLLNDEMDDFSAKPGAPNTYGLVGAQANAIAPGKRPLSSMTPTIVTDARGVTLLGTPGGSRIISMVLLGVLDIAAGKTPEAMVERPRFHHQFLPDVVEYEATAFSPEEIQGLQKLGHSLKPVDGTYGNMQAVFWDRQHKRVSAASDPRGGGQARVDPPAALP
jgi:gamma-glutamyltranspeptidase / glutathione hydrolase